MEWYITPGLTEYPDALSAMAARVEAIQQGKADELVWLVEHPPIYTLGTSAKKKDVLVPPLSSPPQAGGTERRNLAMFPTYETGRGGQVTYHGPGQRVVYLMLDLKQRAAAKGSEPDLRAYVKNLERWIITTLAEFGIEGFIREGRVGVWVDKSRVMSRQSLATPIHDSRLTTHDSKIAALGVRVQKWVTSHGIAINVNPDLSHYAGIVPCGIREYGVTSLHQLGVTATMEAVDAALQQTWATVFG